MEPPSAEGRCRSPRDRGVDLSRLGVICDEVDLTHQSIRPWKESHNPKFEEKRRRIDHLTVERHNSPGVPSMDEIGPISLKPHGGKGSFRKGLLGRISATYQKQGGSGTNTPV
jgi:hypothetical protein